jgi:hypothetical protein
MGNTRRVALLCRARPTGDSNSGRPVDRSAQFRLRRARHRTGRLSHGPAPRSARNLDRGRIESFARTDALPRRLALRGARSQLTHVRACRRTSANSFQPTHAVVPGALSEARATLAARGPKRSRRPPPPSARHSKSSRAADLGRYRQEERFHLVGRRERPGVVAQQEPRLQGQDPIRADHQRHPIPGQLRLERCLVKLRVANGREGSGRPCMAAMKRCWLLMMSAAYLASRAKASAISDSRQTTSSGSFRRRRPATN